MDTRRLRIGDVTVLQSAVLELIQEESGWEDPASVDHLTGAAPTYLASLDVETHDRIRDALQLRLVSTSGAIELTAREWAVRGVVRCVLIP